MVCCAHPSSFNHYGCSCVCHACRRHAVPNEKDATYMYRYKFICFNCRYSWKSSIHGLRYDPDSTRQNNNAYYYMNDFNPEIHNYMC